MAALEGVAHKWREVGRRLRIPDATLSYIGGDDMQKLRSVVHYWVLKDPLASWRRLIKNLYWSRDNDLIRVADNLRSNAEKLTGKQPSHAYGPVYAFPRIPQPPFLMCAFSPRKTIPTCTSHLGPLP